jgi:hypothetical protein
MLYFYVIEMQNRKINIQLLSIEQMPTFKGDKLISVIFPHHKLPFSCLKIFKKINEW